jgi:transposase InsO family protein
MSAFGTQSAWSRRASSLGSGAEGDGYDNALAETINGLCKAELIHRRTPWKTKEVFESAALEWVSWFNHHRQLEPVGYIPPAEAEQTIVNNSPARPPWKWG